MVLAVMIWRVLKRPGPAPGFLFRRPAEPSNQGNDAATSLIAALLVLVLDRLAMLLRLAATRTPMHEL